MKKLILICALLLGVAISTQASEVEASEVLELVEKPKNREVAKYHRRNNRTFKCSLCEPKGIQKLIPKKWRN